jgi:glycerol-3-phosphate dehydrogenase (NAD(P)+)
MNKPTAGVIGAGSFGMAISKLLAFNLDVLVLCRNQKTADLINSTHEYKNVKLDERIRVTTNAQEVCETCRTIFPAVPSASLRETMRSMSPYLKPSHFVIHCTKGLDILGDSENSGELSRADIRTMSDAETFTVIYGVPLLKEI